MALLHFPRRRRSLLGGILVLAIILWLFQQHEYFTTRSITSGMDDSCSKALAKLEARSDTWPTAIPLDGRLGDDVVESLQDLKRFEECALNNGALSVNRLRMIQKKLFPYLNLDVLYSNEKAFWPVYSRRDGKPVKGLMPRFSNEDYKFQGLSKIKYDQRLSFWSNWLHRMTSPGSRGIVISAGSDQLEDCIRLVRVLRFIGNRLPIEIVHKGDLSQDQQEQVFVASTADSTQQYPSQELLFSDVSSMLNPDYAEQFMNFSNKWLALIFSTFQNPILVDADTIPFTSLEIYYEFQQYKSTGALFFKDRKIVTDVLSKDEQTTLRRLFGSLLGLQLMENESEEVVSEKISKLVNDQIATKALHNMIFKGEKHHMESGLVVMDKKRHMSNLLSSVAMQFSSISSYFHGDKEWFWIAQALQKQNFTFHPKEASNIGKLGKVVSDDNREFYQLCSVQLSHTDVDGTLLWVNGGLRTCKKDSWATDFKNNKRIASMFDSEDAVREYYQSPVQLEGVIIPDSDAKPWIMTGECSMFSYCTLYKEGVFGEIIKFTESQKNRYREIVQVWNAVI